MKLVNIKTDASREEVLEMLNNNEQTNSGVVFDQKLGKPFMHVKTKGNNLRIKCELLDRGKKDNEFLIGTRFWGTISEKNGKTIIAGMITTELVFHIMLFVLFGIFIAQCIYNKGFSPIPFILLVFDFYMFRDEFKKQGMIKRYILRAVRRTEANLSSSEEN